MACFPFEPAVVDLITPGPCDNPPQLCKPQRQWRARQSRNYTQCCLLLLETWRGTCPLSPRHDVPGDVASTEMWGWAQWGWAWENQQPPHFPALPFPSSAMVKHWHSLLWICAMAWKVLSQHLVGLSGWNVFSGVHSKCKLVYNCFVPYSTCSGYEEELRLWWEKCFFQPKNQNLWEKNQFCICYLNFKL